MDWSTTDTIGLFITILFLAGLGVGIGQPLGLVPIGLATLLFLLWLAQYFIEGMNEGIDAGQ